MSTRDVRFGIMFFAASEETLGDSKYRLVLEAARFADAHGFSSVWVPERHFATLGGLYPNPPVLHAALAVATSRIHLRAGSVVLPLHDPLRVAEDWSVVDNLSNGRVGVSFASGWNPDDFAFFPGRYERRWEALFEALPVVQRLWRGESVRVVNGSGQEVDVRVYPRPVQPQLPTWITAARSRDTFAKAGEVGANVLTHLLDQEVDEVAGKIAGYRDARARAGHDPAAGIVTIMLHTFVGADADEVREQGRRPYCEFLKSNTGLLKALAASRREQVDLDALSAADKDEFVNLIYDRFAAKRALIGTPESCFDLVAKLKAIGVDEIACLLDFGPTYDQVLENLPYLEELKERCASPSFREAVHRAGTPLVAAVTAPAGVAVDGDTLASVRARCADVVAGTRFYAALRTAGLEVPEPLQSVIRVWRRDGEALAELAALNGRGDIPAGAAAADVCLHASLAALPSFPFDDPGDLLVPWEVPKIPLSLAAAGPLFVHARLAAGGAATGERHLDVRVLSAADDLVVALPRVGLRSLAPLADTPRALDGLAYQLEWRPVDVTPATLEAQGWIILGDTTGVGAALARALSADGHRTRLLHVDPPSVGARGADLDAETYYASIRESVAGAVAELAGGTTTVVFLPPASERERGAAHDVVDLRSAEIVGAGCAADLIRSFATAEQRIRLWLVTRGTQRVTGDDEPIRPAHASLWGLGRTCAIEHPELWGGLVELDPRADDDANVRHLQHAFAGDENQIAYRGDRVWVPRLVRAPTPPSTAVSLDPDGWYMVSGGLNGIGFEVSRWLVRKGARNLLLLGRTRIPAPDDRRGAEAAGSPQVANLRSLEQMGARVEYAAVDVADRDGVAALAESMREQRRVLRGILHAASVWQEGGEPLVRPLVKLDARALHAVFRPKVLGSWTLHEAFADAPLDFFVLFSSAASLTGSAGQGNYAAASAFLDALADYRLQLGQPALSVNWGPVSGAGFGATPEGLKVHTYWESHGLKRISVEQVLHALDALLTRRLSRFAVMDVDWAALARVFPALGDARWASDLVAAGPGRERARQPSAFLQNLLRMPSDEQLPAVVQHVQAHVADVMGLARPPATRKKLFEIGMDSLMAVALKSKLESSLGTEIRVTAVFNYPTIEALSAYLLNEVRATGEKAVEAQAPVSSDGSALSRVQALSDEEVDRLLGARTRTDGRV